MLVTPTRDFGSTCTLPATFLQSIVTDTGIVETVVSVARGRQHRELHKTKAAIGSASDRRLLIPKLEDANMAGTKQWKECTLILTEGDSAKALAVAGLSEVGRDFYGVFPLRGKLLNTRAATTAQVRDNKEIAAIRTILGLQHGRAYETEAEDGKASLRYGKVMLMTDQDHDGSHIKGLFFNIIHQYWPSLLQRNDFVMEFITPIIKAIPSSVDPDANLDFMNPESATGRRRKSHKVSDGNKDNKTEISAGKGTLSFYTVRDYEQWRTSMTSLRGWRIKYYKGLGTNTAQEGREYFRDLGRHRIALHWEGDQDDKAIKLAFADDAELRKQWLSATPAHLAEQVDLTQGRITYHDFVHKELIQYSHASVRRSIPSVLDGLKPGQRKVLFACFKRKLTREIKVAQLSGYVAEQTAYHHGEISLQEAIINMAQNFVGSNNLPILNPSGQFGTRLQGGSDAASSRYIFTRLSSYTRSLFPEADDELLITQEDEGMKIEPLSYIPVIPLILVNGAHGIGTGWATFVPAHHPLNVIDAVIAILDEQDVPPLIPWYGGFKGTIKAESGGQGFLTTGIVEKVPRKANTVQVLELPVGKWTEDFKEDLDKLCAAGRVKSYQEHHTEATVRFVVTFPVLEMSGARRKKPLDAETVAFRMLKLRARLSTANMVAFDADGRLRHFQTAEEMLRSFVPARRELYRRRKSVQEHRLTHDAARLRNRVRFLSMVAAGELAIGGRGRAALEAELDALGFDSEAALKELLSGSPGGSNEDEAGGDDVASKAEGRPGSAGSQFGYLLSMPMWSATEERLGELRAAEEECGRALAELRVRTPEDIWRDELRDLRVMIEGTLRARGLE